MCSYHFKSVRISMPKYLQYIMCLIPFLQIYNLNLSNFLIFYVWDQIYYNKSYQDENVIY